MLLSFSLPAAAQSGRTFYIDYASGSNANPGTKASPWKTHAYMQTGASCTGTGSAPSYSHQAGDRFIFKGGVTWPAACFAMSPSAGGSSNTVRDYYGVDVSYFAGGSFTRPIFNMTGNATMGAHSVIFLSNSGGNITIDSLEIQNQLINGNGNMPCDTSSINLYYVGNITISNSYVHDWIMTSIASGELSNHDVGSICGGGGGTGNTLITGTTSHDANGKVGSTPLTFGACFRNIGEVAFSTCHDVGDGDVGFGQVHDSEFYNITNKEAAYDPTVHTNVIETFYQGDGPFYNNLIHDNNPVGLTMSICAGPSVYNNVMWNNGNSAIIIDPNGAGNTCGNQTTAVANIYNNTFVSTGGYMVYVIPRAGFTVGTINVNNNHWITSAPLYCAGGPCNPVTNFNVGPTNLTMTPQTAANQGYTSANKYASTSSTGGTVGKGTNLSGLCSGGLASLCTDAAGAPWYGSAYVQRPQGSLTSQSATSWDAGAYQFGGQTSSKPNPPVGLAAIVQ
jgi:hypothetical protein